MLINVMLLVSIKACTRILFSLFLCNYHQLFSEYLKAGNLLKLKNLKETGTVCKLKYFLIYRELYRHRNIEQCYRISHILLISCRPNSYTYGDIDLFTQSRRGDL